MSALDDLLAAEAAAAEAFEEDQSTPYPDHVTISQPNRARSKVLQVRLNPGEFEAIERIAAGRGLPPSTVSVALPNAIPMFNTPDPYDYGFKANTAAPPVGTTGAADGIEYRQPRDGTRIEIVGTTLALYFYRADINSWTAASGLTLDMQTPFNNRYNSALASLVAERMMETLPGGGEPTPGLARRIARGRSALMLRTGVHHDRTIGDYF